VAGEEIVSEVLPLVAMLWKGDIGRYQNRPEFKSPPELIFLTWAIFVHTISA
jgi:hypothetical protein